MNHTAHGDSPATKDEEDEDSTLDTNAWSSSFDGVLASVAREVNALHNVLDRLTTDDLQVLGSFPSQPHPLIHSIVACTHCLLLSCSTKHENAPLKLLPWSLLRLELLTKPSEILTKSLKRMHQMRYGRKQRNPLVDSQIRFVMRQLEPFHHYHAAANTNTTISAGTGNYASDMTGKFPSTLTMFTRVSTIAATLAAWVYLSLHYATASPSTRNVAPMSSIHKLLTPVLRSKHNSAETIALPSSEKKQCARQGMKIGSHYFLFQASTSGDVFSKPMYDVFRIDVASNQGLSAASSLQFWKPFCAISGLSKSVELSRLPLRAFKALVLQSAFHDNGFQALASYSPPKHSTISSQSVAPLVLKFTIVMPMKKPNQLELLGIGSVVFQDKTTVQELRAELKLIGLAKYTTTKGDAGENTSVFFLYRGALLALSSERFIPTAALMPFALLCVVANEANPTKTYQKMASLAWEFHSDVTLSLCNAGLPDHIPEVDSTSAASLPQIALYPLDQAVDSKTAHLVASFFVSWTAFERFQQLQDSSSIFQLKPPPAKKKKPKLEIAYADDMPNANALAKPTELPHKVFNPHKEYLWPLYAIAEVQNLSSAVVTALFPDNVEHALHSALETNSRPPRLILQDERIVIHLLRVRREEFPNQDAEVRPSPSQRKLSIDFQCDASCPVSSLASLKNAYIWQVLPIKPRVRGDQPLVSPPPPWLRDIHRFVVHPTLDFTSLKSALVYFRVCVAYNQLESAVEASFWSKDTDWSPYIRQIDVRESVLRQKYDALCLSHPPSFAIDSVKFSKFLRECDIQPALLSIGDVAFLFASHMAPGSHYEMIFDGFLAALERIASQLYGRKKIAHSLTSSSLTALVFDKMIHVPSMLPIWNSVVNSWRLAAKMQVIQIAGQQYCGATRIQARWKLFTTQRIHRQYLLRKKLERRSAILIQKTVKRYQRQKRYQNLRVVAIYVQLRIQARNQLRTLRRERVEYVERMRLRIVKWMRQRLRVLRVWKILNAAWVARRERIRAKRARRMHSAVFQLLVRYSRITLYHAGRDALEQSEMSCAGDNQDDRPVYELEIYDSTNCICKSLLIYQQDLRRISTWTEAQTSVSNKQLEAPGKHILALLVEHLRLKMDKRSHGVSTYAFTLFQNPMDTSLGKLVFQGAVQISTERGHYVHALMLQRTDQFTVLVYTPNSSNKERWEFSACFLYEILQFAQFRNLCLPGPDIHEQSQSSSNHDIIFMIQEYMRSSQRLLVARHIINYLRQYQLQRPRFEMLPHIVARKQQIEQARIFAQEIQALGYRHRLIVFAQAQVRRQLARRARLRLAMISYTKQFDRSLNQFVYALQRDNDSLIYQNKPFSLYHQDVPLPLDEWKPIDTPNSDKATHYFNPLRGTTSPFNTSTAATRIQRWFRKKMWIGIQHWDLKRVSAVINYHQNRDNLDEIEMRKRRAFGLHVMDHEYKAAIVAYESVLQITPDDPQLLAGLALLLIFTCRYPTKQTWPRAIQLLQQAEGLTHLQVAMADVEQNCFCWALNLHPRNADTLGNYAVFLQCVRHEFDTAEIMYRRALDVDPTNDLVLENYTRLERERAPEGLYAYAGPSKVAIWRSREVDKIDAHWRIMEDPGAQFPTAQRFYQNLSTGVATWEMTKENS